MPGNQCAAAMPAQPGKLAQGWEEGHCETEGTLLNTFVLYGLITANFMRTGSISAAI